MTKQRGKHILNGISTLVVDHKRLNFEESFLDLNSHDWTVDDMGFRR